MYAAVPTKAVLEITKSRIRLERSLLPPKLPLLPWPRHPHHSSHVGDSHRTSGWHQAQPPRRHPRRPRHPRLPCSVFHVFPKIRSSRPLPRLCRARGVQPLRVVTSSGARGPQVQPRRQHTLAISLPGLSRPSPWPPATAMDPLWISIGFPQRPRDGTASSDPPWQLRPRTRHLLWVPDRQRYRSEHLLCRWFGSHSSCSPERAQGVPRPLMTEEIHKALYRLLYLFDGLPRQH